MPIKYDNSIFSTGNITFSTVPTVKTISEEGNKSMENLYQVYLVTKNREIRIDTTVVARTEEEAKHEARVYLFLDNNALRLSDVNVIVKNLGSVQVEDQE